MILDRRIHSPSAAVGWFNRLSAALCGHVPILALLLAFLHALALLVLDLDIDRGG
jgi:hypothetical protein